MGRVASGNMGLPERARVPLVVLYYYTASTGITLYNKWLFSVYDLHYPLLVTIFHQVVVSLMCMAVVKWTNIPHPPVCSKEYWKYYVPLGAAIGSDIMLSNTSYLYLEVSFIE